MGDQARERHSAYQCLLAGTGYSRGKCQAEDRPEGPYFAKSGLDVQRVNRCGVVCMPKSYQLSVKVRPFTQDSASFSTFFLFFSVYSTTLGA